MDKYQETSETWNKMASLYEEKFMDLELYNDSYDAFSKLLPVEHSKILEIGCGPGNIAKYLLSKHPNLDYFGTDVAPNMVEVAKKNCPTARFETMEGHSISRLNTTYDGIVCGFVLPYLAPETLGDFIKNCSRKLSENGVLYISFVDGNPNESDFKSNNSGDRVFFNYYQLNELQKVLRANQLMTSSIIHVDFPRGERGSEKHTVLLSVKSLS